MEPRELSRYNDGLRGLITGRVKNFSLLHSVQTASGAHIFYYPMGTGGCFPGVKRKGREADYLFLSIAEIKNGGAIPPLSHIPPWYNA
jgi:hypothetical protein